MDRWRDYLHAQNIIHNYHAVVNPERIIRDRLNPFELFEDREFIRRFRFTKETVFHLINLLKNVVEPDTKRSYSVPSHLQILITLQFYATGTFQITIGDLIRVHQTTVCRIIKRVSIAIANKRNKFIIFPQGQNINVAMEAFYNLAQFPQVVSAIDCSHVPIANPGGEEAMRYINRKGFHSLNCQFTCTSDLRFTSVVARWPGSCHDSRIFRESRLCAQFEEGRLQGVLVGDAGYPLLPFLMTPVNNCRTDAERRYNWAHIQTRNCIERAFGVLKRRFACLHFGLRLKLETCFAVIVAVSILHNIALIRNENLEDLGNELIINPHGQGPDFGGNQLPDGRGDIVRQRIIQSFQ